MDRAAPGHQGLGRERTANGLPSVVAEERDAALVATVALFNYMNRLVEGLGIELDQAYVGVAAQRLADRGYRPLIEMLGQVGADSAQIGVTNRHD